MNFSTAVLLTTLLCAPFVAAQNGAVVELSKADVDAFVTEQFSYYFTDCQKFLGTFGQKFEYCDFAPGIKTKKDGCFSDAEDLLAACLETEGNPTNIYQLEAKPIFTGITSSYNEIAIKGFQKVFDVPVPDATGQVTILDICFDFVLVEALADAPGSLTGIESSFWKGYYSVEFCGIPGAPPCQCDGLPVLSSYNTV